MSNDQQSYFIDGGTLDPDAPSYVMRAADSELFERAQAGDYCHVLTCRQMGKSSLMVRTARQLRETGTSTAIIDLTAIGTHAMDSAAFYLGVLGKVCRDLRSPVDFAGWWEAHETLGAPQRFAAFLREVVLERHTGQVVIFIDEIDSLLKLDLAFRDDFFAAIRALYNQRASDHVLERLSFVLIGAATPNDLIGDPKRTPFNIGVAVTLSEFSPEEAAPLSLGLDTAHPGQGGALLAQVLSWTAGHPYLTQRLCKLIANRQGPWDADRVDQLVAEAFFSDQGRKDPNLTPIQDRVAALPDDVRRTLLKLYRRVYSGQPVASNRQSLAQSYLELFGLVRTEGSGLVVRNRIYRHIFDRNWIAANTPADRWHAFAVGMVLLSILSVIVTIVSVLTGTSRAEQASIAEQQYRTSSDSAVRLNGLATLFNLIDSRSDDSYNQTALRLIYDETPDQAQLFVLDNPRANSAQLAVVAEGLIRTFDPERMPTWERVADSISAALQQAGQRRDLLTLLDYWRAARESLAQGDLDTAIDNYGFALEQMPDHPTVRYERAMAFRQRGDLDLTLSDLEQLLIDIERAGPTPTVETSPTVDPALMSNTPTATSPSSGLNQTPSIEIQQSPITTTLTPVPTSFSIVTLSRYAELRFNSVERVRQTVRIAIEADNIFVQRLRSGSSFTRLGELVGSAVAAAPTEENTVVSSSDTPALAVSQTPTRAILITTPTKVLLTPTPSTPVANVCIVNDTVNLYAAPDSSSVVVGFLPLGVVFLPDMFVGSLEFPWVQVPPEQVTGQSGWVYAGNPPGLVSCNNLEALVITLPTPTHTVNPTPRPQQRLRFDRINDNDDPSCFSIQIKGVDAAGWRFVVDGIGSVVGNFDVTGNARACGLSPRQEVTFTVFDESGRPVRGGTGIPVRGGNIMGANWR